MESKSSEVSHPIYARATPEEADACAWAYFAKGEFKKYYYKFQPLEDNHVRSRILYTSLCMSDSLTGRDAWGESLKPLCPGHEVIGEVIAVGKNVTKFKVGDTVGYGPMRDACLKCETCDKKATQLCPNTDEVELWLYGLYFGGYSTHIQQPETCVVPIPSNLKIKTAAPLLCAGITVYSPLALKVKPGMKVGVIGVGGLGHMAIQIINALGAEAWGFTRNPEKDQFVKEMGGKGVVLWKEKGYDEKIKNTFDVLINTIPFSNTVKEMEEFCNVIKPLGTYIHVGLPDEKETFQVQFFDFVLKNITIYGSLVGGVEETSEMLKFAAEHKIESLCEHYSWEEFPKALDKLENGKPYFRCVVEVDSESKKYQK